MQTDEGHVAVAVEADWDSVVFLDPGPRDAGEKKVSVEHLLEAMSARQEGLWIVERRGREAEDFGARP
jgi:hypothetical protein